MKELKFTSSMQVAILFGKKQQTRCIVKPLNGGEILGHGGVGLAMELAGKEVDEDGETTSMVNTVPCPYGQVGDVLNAPQFPCLSLKITEIRVERLQKITEQDCLKEGIGSPILRQCYRPEFIALWNAIYGYQAWDVNPFVWVISFERCTDNENGECNG
ncbi:hypothetical protein LVJ82_01145 [Vitreoscilla massiliensis]|uniref:ASCH domain-containing protein n=1 Tax=Vitreoscilla massiliensis TaxID=1689272 RepID=A0ABY4E1E6_9NEIS|nr:hypothetical protein [Vitreoscilla massiliensis]UOO89621.1 hypothetical protein LVJ82_01145 [Vitreoscilla massiliensis]